MNARMNKLSLFSLHSIPETETTEHSGRDIEIKKKNLNLSLSIRHCMFSLPFFEHRNFIVCRNYMVMRDVSDDTKEAREAC